MWAARTQHQPAAGLRLSLHTPLWGSLVKTRSSQSIRTMDPLASPQLLKAEGRSSVLQGFTKPPPSEDISGKVETGLWV